MQQCAPIAGLILGAGLGLNARMSTDSNEQQSGEQAGDDCAKTIPRLVLIRDVLCAGNTKRLAEHLDLSLPSGCECLTGISQLHLLASLWLVWTCCECLTGISQLHLETWAIHQVVSCECLTGISQLHSVTGG